MRKLLSVSVIFVCMLALSGICVAQKGKTVPERERVMQVTGEIIALDESAQTLTIEGRKGNITVTCDDKTIFADIKIGDKVTLKYYKESGRLKSIKGRYQRTEEQTVIEAQKKLKTGKEMQTDVSSQKYLIPVAEVEDEKITLEEYRRAYDRAVDFYRNIYKEKFNKEMEKKLRLKEKVLDSLIEETVLLVQAKKIGIKVTDAELEKSIHNDPSFMREGSFSNDIYLRTLELNRITPQTFESMKRRELTLAKIRRHIGESVDVTDADMKQVSGDEQTVKALRQAILFDKREKTVKSYVEGLKKQMKIKINQQLIK